MLLIHLPLNGNINNQGLANVVPVNYGATVDNNGKMGKCYSFDGADDYIYINSSELYHIFSGGSQPFSIAFWVYHADSTRAIIFGDYGLSGAINFNVEFTTNHVVRFFWNGAPDKYFSSCPISASVWAHITLTYDGTTLTCYKDGVLGETWTGPLSAKNKTSGAFFLGRDSRTGSTALNGRLNDFRIYSHALSPREVAEIAKGLVLHYPLGDSYIEGTTNLAPSDGYGITTICYNGATSKYNYGTTTDMYRDIGDYEGRHCTRVRMGTSGLSAFPYVYFNNQTNVGETKTLSFDYFPSANSGRNKIAFYRLSTDVEITYEINGVKGTANNSTGWLDVKLGQWNHIVITSKNIGTANGGLGYMQIGPNSHTSSTDYYWLFSNVQVELKDHATGYIPPGTTRAGGEVYDTSGFGNNGTVNNNLSCATGSPRYSQCTYIPKTANITHPRCLDNSNQEWTCCAWVKLDASTQFQPMNNFNRNNNIVHGTTPLLYLNSGANDYYIYGSEVVPAGTWTHIAFVFKNSNSLRNIYINGVLKNGPGVNITTSTPLGIPDTVILFNNPFSGYVSDYREYATALTADDVLELYHTPISLSNNGALLTQGEFVES